LPIASIFRTKYGEYPEYHTSLDNFNVVTKKGLMGGFRVAKEAVKILLNKIIPKSKILCEPFMLRRKLYPSLSTIEKKKITSSIMNFLQYSDGNNNLMEISKIIKLDYKSTFKIYKILKDKKLLI
jgi:aminopeptidase-like protein